MGSYYAIVIDSPGSADGERLQKEIEEKVGQQIRKYLGLEDEQELGSYADVEIKVFSEAQEKYLAKVTVRIK
jgi:hypothetical protein